MVVGEMWGYVGKEYGEEGEYEEYDGEPGVGIG